MTAAKALKAQPILTALICCETCGEWTDRCVCPDAATPRPGSRTPDGSPGVGDRGGRTYASLVRPSAGRGRTSGGTGLSTTAETRTPADPTSATNTAGRRAPNERNPAMSSTDHASRPHVLAQVVAEDADHLRQSKVRVHSALPSGRRIVAIEICGAVTFQTCITDPSEVAVVLREWADEIDRQAADTGRVTPADAEHLLALANAEVSQ